MSRVVGESASPALSHQDIGLLQPGVLPDVHGLNGGFEASCSIV